VILKGLHAFGLSLRAMAKASTKRFEAHTGDEGRRIRHARGEDRESEGKAPRPPQVTFAATGFAAGRRGCRREAFPIASWPGRLPARGLSRSRLKSSRNGPGCRLRPATRNLAAREDLNDPARGQSKSQKRSKPGRSSTLPELAPPCTATLFATATAQGKVIGSGIV